MLLSPLIGNIVRHGSDPPINATLIGIIHKILIWLNQEIGAIVLTMQSRHPQYASMTKPARLVGALTARKRLPAGMCSSKSPPKRRLSHGTGRGSESSFHQAGRILAG